MTAIKLNSTQLKTTFLGSSRVMGCRPDPAKLLKNNFMCLYNEMHRLEIQNFDYYKAGFKDAIDAILGSKIN